MPISLQHEEKNVYSVEMSGLLRKADLDRCQAALAVEIQRVGDVRLLVLLDRFEGWESHGAWNDLTFYVKHGSAIERIAIVGNPRWQPSALMFAAAGLRRGAVEFFPENDLENARAWLAA